MSHSNEFKRAWLKARGLGNREGIIDCDPDEQTVLFADGLTRTLCDIYTRVMGYHRPVHDWNPGKQSEHAERLQFSEAAIDA